MNINLTTYGDMVISYGFTLARPVSREQAAAYLETIRPECIKGCCGITLSTSAIPGILNVDYVADHLSPHESVIALATAARQLARLHNGQLEEAAIVEVDATEFVRASAEAVVDMARSCGLDRQGFPVWDHTREECIAAVMRELAIAPLTPEALRMLHGEDNEEETCSAMPTSSPASSESLQCGETCTQSESHPAQ